MPFPTGATALHQCLEMKCREAAALLQCLRQCSSTITADAIDLCQGRQFPDQRMRECLCSVPGGAVL